MTENELLKLLGLDTQPERHVVDKLDHDPPLFGRESVEDVEVTDSVLRLTAWDREQGDRLSQGIGGTCDGTTMSDFFNLFYAQRPALAGQCQDGRRQQYVEAMMESESYRMLHEMTRASVLAADAAAAAAAQEFLALVQSDQEEADKKAKGPHPDAVDGLSGAQEGPDAAAMMAALQAAAQALQRAQQEVEEMSETLEAMGGCGLGPGGQGQLDMQRVNSVFQRVRNNRRLRSIFEKAGRFRRYARAAQRSKAIHGTDEVTGVTLGDDVGRLIPTEMALLADDDFEMDALRRLVERQSMVTEMRGKEKKAKGPIVVVVDESGSMAGENIATAKALALTMGWIARHQKRWIAFVGFSGGHDGTRLAMPPGKWNELELIDWLEHFYGGGTTLDVPLDELPNKYWAEFKAPRGKTDVVIITDALVRVPDGLRRNFIDWKKREQVKVISLVLAAASGQMELVSDEVHPMPKLDLSEVGVQHCLEV